MYNSDCESDYEEEDYSTHQVISERFDNGNIKSRETYSWDHKIVSREKFFDFGGLKVKRTFYDSGNVFESNLFNKLGHLVNSVTYYDMRGYMKLSETSFDDEGNRIEKKFNLNQKLDGYGSYVIRTPEGDTLEWRSYKNGNQVDIVWNSEPTRWFNQEVTY